jgi:hypothetical protein
MPLRHLLTARATALALGLLALAAPSPEAADPQRPEISFTARTLREENVEGPDVERTYFTAGRRRIIFGTPKGCRLSLGEGGGVVLLLNDTGLDGEIHVSQSPFSPQSDLAAEALTYREAASRSLPGDVTNLEVQPPALNPYPYNGWKSLGFTWTYASYGRAMTRTVSYINLEIGVQIVVTTLAVNKDAAKVGKLAREFMSSWWVMGDGSQG